MEELNLMDLLGFYVKKIPYILVVMIITGALGVLYIFKIQEPLYHGQTTIVLVQSSENTAMTQTDLNLQENLVKTYTEIIKSKRVLSQVIKDLRLNMSVGELHDNITVSSVSEAAIIKIVVSDADKKLAVSIANKTADIFSREVRDLYNLENVSILDKAEVEKNPYNVNLVKQMVIYEAIAIVLVCAIIFVSFYFNDSVKSKKEIESRLNIAVLGEIPQVNKANLKAEYYTAKPKKNKKKEQVEEKNEGEE